MTNKAEIAELFDASVGQMVDSIRHFHVWGTIDDLNTLLVSDDAVGVFRAPFACELKTCIVRVETIEADDSNNEFLHLRKAASGVVLSSGGTDIITPIRLDSNDGVLVASTDYSTVVNADGTQVLAVGDMVGFDLLGTIGALTGVFYDLTIERLN